MVTQLGEEVYCSQGGGREGGSGQGGRRAGGQERVAWGGFPWRGRDRYLVGGFMIYTFI